MAIFIRAASDTGGEAPRTQAGVPVSGRALRPQAEHRWWHPLLRDGVRPLFLAGDVAACLLATVLSNDSWVLGLAFMALLIPLLSQAGLYRSRLALSVLDDLP